MKNVLVWQSYGTVRVHPAEFADDLTAILAKISVILASWHFDDALDTLAPHVRSLVDQGKIGRAREAIATFCSNHKDHESFETFEFCTIQELM